MADAVRDQTENSSTVQKALVPWQRVVLGVLGLCGIGGGAAATFVTKNSVGSGALLALGALFALIGVTGSSISRAKFGDSEVMFAAVRATVRENIELQSAVNDALTLPDPEVRPELAEAILSIPLSRSSLARRHAEYVDYESRALEAVKQVIEHVTIPSRGARAWFDAIAHFQPAGTTKRYDIGIEIKFIRHASSQLNDVLNQVVSGMMAEGSVARDGAVVITNGDPPPVTAKRLGDFPQVRFITWNENADNYKIVRAVESIADTQPK